MGIAQSQQRRACGINAAAFLNF